MYVAGTVPQREPPDRVGIPDLFLGGTPLSEIPVPEEADPEPPDSPAPARRRRRPGGGGAPVGAAGAASVRARTAPGGPGRARPAPASIARPGAGPTAHQPTPDPGVCDRGRFRHSATDIPAAATIRRTRRRRGDRTRADPGCNARSNPGPDPRANSLADAGTDPRTCRYRQPDPRTYTARADSDPGTAADPARTCRG